MLLTVLCGESQTMHDRLIERYGEIPLVEGEGNALITQLENYFQAGVRLYVNPETNTFSLIIINGAISCVVLTGKDLRPVQPDGIPL